MLGEPRRARELARLGGLDRLALEPDTAAARARSRLARGGPGCRRPRRSSTPRASRAGRRRSARRPRSPRAHAATRRRCPLPRTGPRARLPGAGVVEPREEPLVVEDPVEGRVREDRVDRRGERRGRAGRRRSSSTRSPKPVSRSRAVSIIEGEPSTPITLPLGEALREQAGDPARAAAGVEHGLVDLPAPAARAPRGPTPPAGRRGGRRPRASQSTGFTALRSSARARVGACRRPRTRRSRRRSRA